ncbi:MAG: hypothetical protein IJ341_12520 [Bacteroidales bacterium]|nr:hypothetical protein [Bacteroidales bacterium]
MSFVYSSNSPEFLDYVAHTKTRNDIINDPRLCFLLEDPEIKDNMELALLYREAQYGNYEKKKEFIGYLLANGPELDTDTIMYYREKILHSPTYSNIYVREFKYNMSIIDELRINRYGKDTTDTNDALNCLSNPCDYLGPFSSSIGLAGDEKNFNTLSNVIARLSKPTQSIQENEDKDTSSRIWGNIPQHIISKLIPDLERSYRTLLGNMSASYSEFVQKANKVGLGKDLQTVGDAKAEEKAKDIASAIKVNIVSNLGDCARIWEYMRRLRVYDPSKNAKKPFQEISKKTVDGAPAPNYTPVTDAALRPEPLSTKHAPSGTTNITPPETNGIDINSLDTRWKQTYSIWRYILDNHELEIMNDGDFGALTVSTMEGFIEEMDAYLEGEGLELPEIPTVFHNLQQYESGWTRGYKGILTD